VQRRVRVLVADGLGVVEATKNGGDKYYKFEPDHLVGFL
jgi:hypothetical protein